jgi:hypothetical protein
MLEKLVTKTLHDPLAAGRTHHQEGGTVIGYVGSEIPVELIIAAGAMPLQLSGLMPSESKFADADMVDAKEWNHEKMVDYVTDFLRKAGLI